MKLWDKIKEWFKKWWHNWNHSICPICKKELNNNQFNYTWINDVNECDTCYWTPIWDERDRQANKEREARINEMAEAIRRASPVAVKQVKDQ